MKYLLIATLLTGCNFGLVDVKHNREECIGRKITIGDTATTIDSTRQANCGTNEVTTPIEMPKW